MGFGMVLGGIAKGLTEQQDLAQKRQALALQTAELQNNNAYRNAALGLEAQRLKATTGIEQTNQARVLYDNLMENVKATVVAALKNNNTPDQIKAAIAPQVQYMQNVVGPAAGVPAQVTDHTVSALIGIGSPAPTTGDVMGPILDDFANGRPMSKQKKALLDNYFKQQNPLAGMIQQAMPDSSAAPSTMVPDLASPGGTPQPAAPAAPAPAAAPTAAPAAASMAPEVTAPAAPTPKAPPIPKSLVGKSPRWSPNDPNFFFLPDGTITDLQGNPLGKVNGAK